MLPSFLKAWLQGHGLNEGVNCALTHDSQGQGLGTGTWKLLTIKMNITNTV
jgi:hypothetical protein